MLQSLLRAFQNQLLKDPNLLREDDYFLLKKEKILMLGSVVEKGAGHLVINVKGAELQEMTECHQHESQGIERNIKRLSQNRCNLMVGNVLTPLKLLRLQHFYDDLKFLLTGNVESLEFKEGRQIWITIELKKLFAKSLALCLSFMAKDLRLKKLGLFDQHSLQIGGAQSKKYFDSQWHQLLGLKEKFQASVKHSEPIPPPVSQKQQIRVVHPSSRKMDFLESISQKVPEKKIEKVEPVSKPREQQRPVRSTKQSQTANLFDILDDIDEDDSEEQVKSLLKDPPVQFRELKPEKASKPFEDDDLEKELESIYQPKKLEILAPTPKVNNQEVDFGLLLQECFLAVFGKEYISKEQLNQQDYYGLFSGYIPASVQANRLDEQCETDLRFEVARALILKAFRIAFHLAFDNSVNYLLGEETPHQELRDMLLEIERDWLLGNEPRLWNGGIGRNLPQMERIIKEEKLGEQTQFKMHRLMKKQNQKIHLFGMKGSAVRGIQANMALELLYFSNNNDQRFSIQSEENLLRNLVVQFTEAPLGYSVYSSGPSLLYY